MRKPKPKGNHKHSADACGVCAKPTRYKKRQELKEQTKEQLDAADSYVLDSTRKSI